MVAQTMMPAGLVIVHVMLESVIISCDEAYVSFLGVPRDEAVGSRLAVFMI